MSFPVTRMRRLRRNATLRTMVREHRLAREDLILPLFVVEGAGVREAIASMPGVFRHSVDQLVLEAKRVADLGVPAVILFGIPDAKDARGSGADAADGIVQRASRAIVVSQRPSKATSRFSSNSLRTRFAPRISLDGIASISSRSSYTFSSRSRPLSTANAAFSPIPGTPGMLSAGPPCRPFTSGGVP